MPKNNRSSARELPTRDYVSLWQWLFIQFLMILPLINLVAMLVMAFVGQNRSRKNFFRAALIWLVLVFVLHFLLFVLLVSTDVFKWLKEVWAIAIDMVSLNGSGATTPAHHH